MKPASGKSREELALEKRRELERRLQDVSGQLNSVKKPQKPKGENRLLYILYLITGIWVKNMTKAVNYNVLPHIHNPTQYSV